VNGHAYRLYKKKGKEYEASKQVIQSGERYGAASSKISEMEKGLFEVKPRLLEHDTGCKITANNVGVTMKIEDRHYSNRKEKVMCKPASFVIAENGKRAFWSRTTDSHEEIITEHKIVEQVAGNICIVRCEIVPPDEDMTRPLRQWIYNKDQDLLPEWYDAEAAEKLCRLELKKWFASKVFLDGVHEIKEGVAYVNGGSVRVNGGSAEVYGGSAVVYGGSVRVYGGSAVVNGGSAVVYGGSVRVYGGSAVVYGGSAVVYGGSVRVNGGSAVVYGGSVRVYGGSAEVYGGSAEVKGKENATIVNYTTSVIPLKGNAVCIDRTGVKLAIHTA
jgi:hypothetical protein